MSKEDKSGPALVSSRWSPEMIAKWKAWHRRTSPWHYEKGTWLRFNLKQSIGEFWLRDGERVTLKDYRRLLPESRAKLKPEQLPEGLEE